MAEEYTWTAVFKERDVSDFEYLAVCRSESTARERLLEFARACGYERSSVEDVLNNTEGKYDADLFCVLVED